MPDVPSLYRPYTVQNTPVSNTTKKSLNMNPTCCNIKVWCHLSIAKLVTAFLSRVIKKTSVNAQCSWTKTACLTSVHALAQPNQINLIFNRSTHQWCSMKKEACNPIKKETLSQMLSYEFCEISKNTVFTEHLQTTASVLS